MKYYQKNYWRKGSKKYHPWKKGDRIKRGDRIGTVITNGYYMNTSSHGLWYYTIQWENGEKSEAIFPCVGDIIL